MAGPKRRDGARGRRRRHSPVVLLDGVNRRRNFGVLGGQSGVEAGEKILGRDQVESSAGRRDGDGGSDLMRHLGAGSLSV